MSMGSTQKSHDVLSVLTSNQLYSYRLQSISLPAVSQMLVTSKRMTGTPLISLRNGVWGGGENPYASGGTFTIAHFDAVVLINDTQLLLSECYSKITKPDFIDTIIYSMKSLSLVFNSFIRTKRYNSIYEFWPAQQLTCIYFYPVLTFPN
jgi:hypothetical protein